MELLAFGIVLLLIYLHKDKYKSKYYTLKDFQYNTPEEQIIVIHTLHRLVQFGTINIKIALLSPTSGNIIKTYKSILDIPKIIKDPETGNKFVVGLNNLTVVYYK